MWRPWWIQSRIKRTNKNIKLKGILKSKEPQLYKFKDIENRLHTLEPGKSYIKPFVTSKVSNTMCGGLNFLNKVSVPWDLTCDEIIYCMEGTFRLTCDG